MAALLSSEHTPKASKRCQELEDWKQLGTLERALDDLTRHVRDLGRDALTGAGYHQHHRGEWRRRRG